MMIMHKIYLYYFFNLNYLKLMVVRVYLNVVYAIGPIILFFYKFLFLILK